MNKVCANCRHFAVDYVTDAGIAPCEKQNNENHYADDIIAQRCRDYSERRYDIGKAERAFRDAKEYREKNRGYSSSGCFITTAVVHILGMRDDCTLLETLRFLRGHYMQCNPQYRELLLMYDTVGPALATAVNHDENNYAVAQDILIYLKKAQHLVALEMIDEAISLYKDMTERLMEKYMIRSCWIGDRVIENYDQLKGGHGAFTITKKD